MIIAAQYVPLPYEKAENIVTNKPINKLFERTNQTYSMKSLCFVSASEESKLDTWLILSKAKGE